MVGKSLLHFEILQKIGAGGMGEVYRARDSKLGRDVALKFLPVEMASDRERVARFQQEARALATLNHPNVASIYSFEQVKKGDGQEEDSSFLVMEVVEGNDLAHRLKQGPMTIEEVIRVAIQITDALAAAHDRGIVHRDLKPANILFTDKGDVKILDFGLAKFLYPETGAEKQLEETVASLQDRRGGNGGVLDARGSKVYTSCIVYAAQIISRFD